MVAVGQESAIRQLMECAVRETEEGAAKAERVKNGVVGDRAQRQHRP